MNQAQLQQREIDQRQENNRDDESGMSQSIPGEISILVKTITQLQETTISLNVSPKIKFNQLSHLIMNQIFSNIPQKQFDNTIRFQIKGQELGQNDERTLKDIGMVNNDIITVRLQLKGGGYDNE